MMEVTLVRRISAKEAQDTFPELLGSVHESKEPVIVEKQGRPLVVVISVEDYERFVGERRRRLAAVLDEIHADNEDKTAEEVEADVAAAVAAVRAEKRTRRRTEDAEGDPRH